MQAANLTRTLATLSLDALRKAGHIVLAPGGGERVVRDLSLLIEPALKAIVVNIDRSPIMGEVSSTFGSEATDEAVEELVSALREAVLDSEGVEDVFADDRTIERVIFRSLADTLLTSPEATAVAEEEEIPPISVRLDTLGYVAATAARTTDKDTLEHALSRAAELADAELKTFDEGSRTAFFRPLEPDPERRLDIEAAIEEELSDLVDMGVVDLPTVTRSLPLPALVEDQRRALRKRLDELAQKHLTIAVCPGTWDWGADKRSVSLVFTPLSEHDAEVVERATAVFAQDLEAMLQDLSDEASTDPPKQATRGGGGARAGAASPIVRGALSLVQAVEALSAPKSSRSGVAKATDAAKPKVRPKKAAGEPSSPRKRAPKPAAKPK